MIVILFLRTLIVLLWAALSLLLVTPSMFYYRLRRVHMNPDVFDRHVHKVASAWASGILFFSGARIHIEGMENIPKDSSVLFISNHQSNFDFMLFLAKIKKEKGFVAKIETTKIPLVRTWMRFLKCVFLDRNDIKQTAKTILEGIEILKSGHSLALFPEGTRSKSDDIGEFKAGSFKLATKSKVPIVPVSLSNVYMLMENNKNFIRSADVYITIHPAITTAGLSLEEERELVDKVKAIIEKGIKKTKTA